MHTSTTVISISLLCSGALLFTLWKSRARRANRNFPPPGPSGLPWVGNVFDIDVSQPWVTYQEWGNRYGKWSSSKGLHSLSLCILLGDLTYSQVLGKEYIIVNSEKVAHELLDQRSSIYSDRARVPSIEL